MSSLNELRSRENEPLALFLFSFLFRFFDIHFGWKWEPLTPLDWDVGATPSELEWVGDEKRYRKYSCRCQGTENGESLCYVFNIRVVCGEGYIACEAQLNCVKKNQARTFRIHSTIIRCRLIDQSTFNGCFLLFLFSSFLAFRVLTPKSTWVFFFCINRRLHSCGGANTRRR